MSGITAVVQRDMKLFAGREWKRGEEIPSEILGGISRAAINALVSQKDIAITSEDGQPVGPTDTGHALRLDKLEEAINGLAIAQSRVEEKLDELLAEGNPNARISDLHETVGKLGASVSKLTSAQGKR